jgi:hypothetical protein
MLFYKGFAGMDFIKPASSQYFNGLKVIKPYPFCVSERGKKPGIFLIHLFIFSKKIF